METRRLEFSEALKELAEEAGIQLTNKASTVDPIFYGALESACQFFERNLPNSPAESYLGQRKISALESWSRGGILNSAIRFNINQL